MHVVHIGNDGLQQPPTEPLDDATDERDAELVTRSSIEACSSLGCLSPRASTDALLPSFQPDDDTDVKSPQPSAVAEHSPRNYPGSVPHFPRRLSRSPRLDEPYLGSGHASSYAAAHSPRPGVEVTTSAVHHTSYSEQAACSSPHSPAIIIEDLTSQSKLDRAVAEKPEGQFPNTGDGSVSKEMVRSTMDLLRVTSSPTTISRQPRYAAANCDLSKVNNSSVTFVLCLTCHLQLWGMEAVQVTLLRRTQSVQHSANVVHCINEVTLRRTRLVFGWLTAFRCIFHLRR